MTPRNTAATPSLFSSQPSASIADADPQAAPLVAILGPTASGKSALGVALAQRFAGEVLVCDSTQVYRGFDIGTAKPTAEERGGIAHRLLDLVEPNERFTAGDYRRHALEVLDELAHRESQKKRLPIFTVGTGLYLRALLEGLADAPQRCDAVRARLNLAAARHDARQDADYLHRMLRRLDPVAAKRISPRDRQKLIRALEVCLLTGKPLTELHDAGRAPLQGYRPLKIGLNPPRAELWRRIELRVHAMLERGWLAEVAALSASDLPPGAFPRARGADGLPKPFDFLGYRQLRAHLQHGPSLAQAVEETVFATRRYAKRQLTWFRREPGVHWLPAAGDAPETLAAAGDLIEKYLVTFTAPAAK
jgi:tRNA dimethylallyltransferase